MLSQILSERYLIHWGKELAWALVVGVLAYLATQVAAADVSTIDPVDFGISLGVGAGRLALAIALNAIRTLIAGAPPS